MNDEKLVILFFWYNNPRGIRMILPIIKRAEFVPSSNASYLSEMILPKWLKISAGNITESKLIPTIIIANTNTIFVKKFILTKQEGDRIKHYLQQIINNE